MPGNMCRYKFENSYKVNTEKLEILYKVFTK